MTANNRIKKFREGKGLGQKEFSNLIGVNNSYYSDVENGRRKVTENLVSKIKKHFSISSDWVFGTVHQNDKESKNNNTPQNTPNSTPKSKISVSPLQMEVFKILEKNPDLNALNVNIRKVALFSMVSDYISDTYFSPVIKHAGENVDFKEFIKKTNATLTRFKKYAPAFAKLAKAMEVFEKEMYKAGDKFFEYTDEAFIENESKYDQ